MDSISDNISFSEATKSQTAIRAGINNSPNDIQLKNMQLVASKVFEPLRKAYGKPIKINSFFRSELLNKKIGGAKGSQHTTGEAIDLDADEDNSILFFWIKNNLDFDQLIWEFGDANNPDWVHVSYKESGNRKEILRAVKINGKTVYKKFDL